MMKSYQLENFLKLRKKMYSSVVEKTHILGDMTISFKFLSHWFAQVLERDRQVDR